MISNEDLDLLNGTIINYYFSCKREAWLIFHNISADQWDENIIKGRALADKKDKKHNFMEYLKFDRIEKKRGHFEVTEYKKTLKNHLAASKQLLFYIFLLKRAFPKLKIIRGYVKSKNKKVVIETSEEILLNFEEELLQIIKDIQVKKSPVFEYKKLCDSCAYNNYCF